MKNAPIHILIVGGGLGGLCLAQGLKKSGISVAVYERDRFAHFRGQGYRIGIKAAGALALRDCLPENLFNLCVATSIKAATRMVFLDHQLNQSRVIPLSHDEPGVSGFGVNRLTLREILLAGLAGTVHFGKTFERFDQLADGRVRAHFADGTTATGDLLVGADGTSSAVRELIAPDARIDSVGSLIYGRTLIGPDTLEWVPDVLVDTFNNLRGPAGVSAGVATCRQLESNAAATATFAPDLRLTDSQDYLAWTVSRWSAQPPLPGDEFRNAASPALHRLARDLLAGWHLLLRRIVDEADVPATFPVIIRSAQPVEPWQTANVTLLGDAIHTMSPGRGEGANIALRDAQLLCRKLVDAAASRVPLRQAKEAYEAEMLRYGFAAVADSLTKPFMRRLA